MNEMKNAAVKKAVVTLGADVGGKDAHLATHTHVLVLRQLLADGCRGPYSATIKEFALVLRIDGSIQAWGKSGIDGVALGRRNSFATADIYVPRDAWSPNDSTAFRSYLASGVKEAIAEISRCAKHRGVDLLSDDLERDVGAAALKFTAQ